MEYCSGGSIEGIYKSTPAYGLRRTHDRQPAHTACVPESGESTMPVLQKPFREEEIAAVLRDALTVRNRIAPNIYS